MTDAPPRSSPMRLLGRLILAATIAATMPVVSQRVMATPVSMRAADAREIECLALTMYFEARGESDRGKLAVGHVVLNRTVDRRFPDSICAVVKDGGDRLPFRCQFTWWCDGRSDRPAELSEWKHSMTLARQIFAGQSIDPTNGALWYHAAHVRPKWRKAFFRGPRIGNHLFYLAGKPEPRTAPQLAVLLPVALRGAGTPRED